MTSPWRRASLVVAVVVAVSAAVPAEAQQQAARPLQQVISANPFGMLLELFNAEYERRVSASATAGIGGSFLSNSGDDYINADVFYRFYPSGKPLDGLAFGVKAGMTRITDSGTYFGFGFDLNQSWLMGKNDNFYIGIGFGLKRLFGVNEDELAYVPTVRIVNIGFAF
jgi:hypothetical protein